MPRPSRHMLLCGLLAASAAQAYDFAVNAGAIEVVGLPPQHLGLYPYVGFSVAMPYPKVTMIYALSLEISPDQGRLGLVAVATADFLLRDGIGFDVNLALIHDQPAFHLEQSSFFVGGGPGVSFFLGKWAVSPYLSFFVGGGPSYSLVPGLNVAYTY